MTTWSKTQTVKSNARRAAKAAGVDPELVVSCSGGFHFPLPDTTSKAKPKAKTAKAPKLKLEGGKAKAPKGSALQRLSQQRKASGTDHRTKVLQMITRNGGAKMSELEAETGLLPHTLRARISEIKRAEKLDVKRERLLGVTIYSATHRAA